MESAAFIPAGTVLGQCPLYAHVSTNPQQLIYLKRLCNERKTTAYTGTWGTLITWQLGAVDATYQKTALTKSLTLSVPRWSGHLAGQHVDIRLTAEDGYQAERGYSIASLPRTDSRSCSRLSGWTMGKCRLTSPMNCAWVTSWSYVVPSVATLSGRRAWADLCS